MLWLWILIQWCWQSDVFGVVATRLKSSIMICVEPTALVCDVVLISTGLKSSLIRWVEPMALVGCIAFK